MTHETTSQRPIFVVEDSREDFDTLMRAFREVGIGNPVERCETGDEALEHLRAEAHRASDGPALILLDLNLPGTDGRDVLRALKRDERLMSIPVIVLTTSSDPRDVEDCYAIGANTYVRKPSTAQRYVALLRHLRDWWLREAVLPARSRA